MMHLHKTYLTALLATFFCIGSCVALGFFWHITEKTGIDLHSRIETIANNNAREQVYLDLQKAVDASEGQRKEMMQLILTEGQTSTFLTDLESLGTTQGVLLVTDSLEVKKQTGLFDLLLVRFSISGTKENVTRMITLFESLPYVNNIMKLTIEHLNEGTRASVEMKLIVLKENV